jgi:hypothetical protein
MKWDADAPCSFSSSSLWPSSGGFAARESRQEAGSSAPLVSEGGAHSRIGWCSTLHSSQLPLRYPSRDVGTPCEMTTYTPPGLRTRCISLTILLTCGRHAAHRLSSRGAVRGGRGEVGARRTFVKLSTVQSCASNRPLSMIMSKQSSGRNSSLHASMTVTAGTRSAIPREREILFRQPVRAISLTLHLFLVRVAVCHLADDDG